MGKVTLTNEQDFKDRYVSGTSLRLLAEEAQCSVPTMRRKLASLGCDIRQRGRPRLDGQPVRTTGTVEEGDSTTVVIPADIEEAPTVTVVPGEAPVGADKRFDW